MSIVIKPADPAESAFLSDLAFRSKAHWGYSYNFMKRCRVELTNSDREIENGLSYVLLDENRSIGFYILLPIGECACELEALFVEPTQINKGYGRKLMNHAQKIAARTGFEKIVIQSDPNSLAFYLTMGAVRRGSKDSSSIPGRELPMLELQV